MQKPSFSHQSRRVAIKIDRIVFHILLTSSSQFPTNLEGLYLTLLHSDLGNAKQNGMKANDTGKIHFCKFLTVLLLTPSLISFLVTEDYVTLTDDY